MAQAPKTPDQTAAQPSKRESAFDLRIAELEWRKTSASAFSAEQKRLNEAFAEYQQAMARIHDDTLSKELAAFQRAASNPEDSPSSRADQLRAVQDQVAEVRGEATRLAGAATRKLAEQQQQAWWDRNEAIRDGYATYVKAVRTIYSMPELHAQFGVGAAAADEGLQQADVGNPVAQLSTLFPAQAWQGILPLQFGSGRWMGFG
jgi:hypothetical protein